VIFELKFLRHHLLVGLVVGACWQGAVGVSTGHLHSAVWTEAGELFTFGSSLDGALGLGGGVTLEDVPILVDVLRQTL